MKKIFSFLIAILITAFVSGQNSNTFKYVINANGGIVIPAGNTDTLINNINADLADYSTLDTALFSRKASPTFTGVPTAPTASVGTNTTQIATTAFVTAAHPVDFALMIDPQSLATPLDNTLYYYGSFPMGSYTTTVNEGTIIMPFNCTLVGYSLMTKSTAACTAETGTLSVRINNTTDVQLSAAVTWGVGGANKPAWFSSAALNTNINAGDKLELKLLTPTWTTDATSMYMTTILYFKNR